GPDYGPDPAPAAYRHHLRPRSRLGHRPDRQLQADRPAHLPHGAFAPSLRACRLGRREDHHALLDRRCPRRSPWSDVLLLDLRASRMIDMDRLSLDSFAGQPVAVLGLARSGVALTRF